MAENAQFLVEQNVLIAQDVYLMRLSGPTGSLVAPGQFINIALPGFYLRRPISVCRWGNGWVDIIYKVVGQGTAAMAGLAPGAPLDVLAGLGNGFSPMPGMAAPGAKTVLIGGGVGVPPLYALAAALCRQGPAPDVVLGFRSSADVFFSDEFDALGCAVYLATEDGTAGRKGFVTHILEDLSYTHYYTCGPSAMLRAVYTLSQGKKAAGQLSFEERMGCGFGACMGCSCHTKSGPRRVCAEGPVFASGEVMFE